MGDFFSNLLARSAVDSTVTVSLRPRLPSLFEPLHGVNEFPAPIADSLERKRVAQAVVPASIEMIQTKMPSAPSTIRVDDEPISFIEENRPQAKPYDTVIPPKQETQSNTSPKTGAEKGEARFEEPLAALVPDDRQKPSVNKTSQGEENPVPSVNLERRKETLRMESLPIQVQKASEMLFSHEPIKKEREISVKPMKEDLVPENVITDRRETPKTQPDLITALRPVIPAPHLTERSRLEPPQQQEPPRVVEIHIGRIEVRAMTAPAAPPTKPRPTGVMTLDEYLQRRNTRDH